MKKLNNFFHEDEVNLFTDVIVALIIATFAITGMYSNLFIAFALQAVIILLIMCYKRFKYHIDEGLRARIDLSNASPGTEVENVKNEYYKENNVLIIIKSLRIFSIILLILSIFLVWYFPFKEEREKKIKIFEQNELLLCKIDSIKIEINSLKDSLSLNKKAIQSVATYQQKLQSKHLRSK